MYNGPWFEPPCDKTKIHQGRVRLKVSWVIISSGVVSGRVKGEKSDSSDAVNRGR